jgi:predicted TIM-barrel fold metal-dependent hydrolase
VFLVDLERPDAMDEVTRWAGRGWFRGIRMAAETLPARRALWDWAATAGALGQFAADHPRSALVLTHLGHARDEAARAAVLGLAWRENVCVQVSGMHSYGAAPYEELRLWISRLHRGYGDERLLYGSNYPVMGEDAVHAREIELLREGLLGVPRGAAEQVLNSNALRVWFGDRR